MPIKSCAPLRTGLRLPFRHSRMAQQRLIDRFPQYRDKYHADLVADLHLNEKSALIGHFCVIWIVVAAKWEVLPQSILLTWAGLVNVAVAIRYMLYRSYQRRPKVSEHDVKLHTIGISTMALAWSIGFLTILPHCRPADVPLLMMVIAVISASAIISLSARLKSYAVFSSLLVMPCVVGLFFSSNPDYTTGSLAIIFLVFCGSGVKRANQISQSAMIRRYQNSEIMRDLGKAKRQLQEAVRSAEAASNAKQEFLANVSHEIRTPMNGVLGMTDLVLETQLNKDQRRCLETARRSGTSLLYLIDDLLDFSKIEAGKMDIEMVPYELRPMIQDLVEVHRHSGKAKAEILLHIDDSIPETIIGDPNRIRQVLNNLIGNAVKFTPKGFIRVTASHAHEDGDNHLNLAVSDDGVGIPADRLASIFESFTQADGSTTRNYGGTGLGLTISRNLAELMGGMLSVQSDVGVGSTFTACVPLVKQENHGLYSAMCILAVGDGNVELVNELRCSGANAEAGCLDGELWNTARGLFHDKESQHFMMLAVADFQAHNKLIPAFLRHFQCTPVFTDVGDVELPLEKALRSHGETDSATLERLVVESRAAALKTAAPTELEVISLRILVAEDHPTNATIVRRMLETMGHEVEVAGDGQAAVDAFTRNGADLILMDLQMPVMGGHEACRIIRRLEDGKHIPILALTAHATAEERQLSMESGMDDHLTKPFTRDELTTAIQLWGTSHHSPEKLS
jgi:signal transduction histidine kinase/ActR/RegA family two-component response regulator